MLYYFDFTKQMISNDPQIRGNQGLTTKHYHTQEDNNNQEIIIS